ncbi:SDR family oxidoreductase [Neorhizobium huautlense]|uniref:SDR family oxidoreductase n=1 Tax=Neorhizobium huautlense TaxID=67774 RepID=UPI0027D86078|nr:SDR family oxidoreductase [Neorhizobium huautlense]
MNSSPKRTALLLGSSKGLGFGVADALTRKGVDVILVGRDQAALKSAEAKLQGRDGSTISIAGDLSDRNSVAQIIAETDRRVGGIDILLLNGGGPPPIAASRYDEQFWQKQFSAMFLSQLEIAAHYLPGMCQRGFGRIIAVSSTSIREPIPGLAASNALRSALAGWAKTLATEVAGKGVTVNVLLPGRFATERTARLDAMDAAERGVDQDVVAADSQREIPVGRYGRPEEFADVVAFLASEEASYITGVALPVDGGLSRSI